MRKVQFFWTLFKRGGGGGQPMFKNYVGNCRVFWRSFNNMKFAWKGTFEALMVKFEGKIGTLYQIFTPCTHCKFCMMFKRKGGGSKAFWTMFKKLHFSLGMASLIMRKYTGFFLLFPQKIPTHYKSYLKPGCDTRKVYIVQILLVSPNLASE